MDAYEFVYYVLRHAVPGSTAGFSTGSAQFILMKDEVGMARLVYCLNEEVEEKRFRFGEENVNRVANEIVNLISEVSGFEVKEVQLLKSVDFSGCFRKEERPRRKAKPKEELNQILQSLKQLPQAYSFIPLFSLEGKIVGLVPETFALVEGNHREPARVRREGTSPLTLNADRWFRYSGYLKADKKFGNPLLSYGSVTTFSALLVETAQDGQQGEWRGRRIPKKTGTFFVFNSRGKAHTEELEFLDYSPLQPKRLSYGLFVKEGETIVRLGGGVVSSVEALADYVISSTFAVSNNGELSVTTLRELSDFVINMIVSKYMPSKSLKDFILVISNPIQSTAVLAFDGRALRLSDPVSYWICQVLEECERGEAGTDGKKEEVKRAFNLLSKKGMYRSVFL